MRSASSIQVTQCSPVPIASDERQANIPPRCFGAASAKKRLDVVIRDAINAGDIPGPRYLANGQEMARTGGELVAPMTAFADGPDQMREVIREHVDIGVDNIKLSMSGEEVSSSPSPPRRVRRLIAAKITEIRSAQDCYFTDEETAACVDEAHKFKKRLCAHARARDSVKMCKLATARLGIRGPTANSCPGVRHGVDVIYHASYIDDEGWSFHAVSSCSVLTRCYQGMDMLEKKRTKHIVAPGINWIIATLYEAEAFGYPPSKAEQVGYKRELDAAVAGLREMHRRGIVVLPGGDYGFAWTPHGTYARDLQHFVERLEFTPHEAIIAATRGVAALMMRPHELGQIQPGYYADCILVDGNPLEDITVLQDHSRLNIICINGRVHKAGRKEYLPPPVAGQDNNIHVIAPDRDVPEVKKEMQK